MKSPQNEIKIQILETAECINKKQSIILKSSLKLRNSKELDEAQTAKRLDLCFLYSSRYLTVVNYSDVT